jgi:hypothetical protein
MKAAIIALLGILLVSNAFSAGTHIYQIPDCPADLTIKIYTFVPASKKLPDDLPTLKNNQSIRDAKPYLRGQGIDLTESGFAYYFPEQHFLIAASDRKGQDLLQVLLD